MSEKISPQTFMHSFFDFPNFRPLNGELTFYFNPQMAGYQHEHTNTSTHQHNYPISIYGLPRSTARAITIRCTSEVPS